MSEEALPYFLDTRSKMFGRPFESFDAQGEERIAIFKKLEEIFDKFSSYIDAGGGPYFGGTRPIFVDMALLGTLLKFRETAPKEEWEQITTKWQNGRWGRLIELSKVFIKEE